MCSSPDSWEVPMCPEYGQNYCTNSPDSACICVEYDKDDAEREKRIIEAVKRIEALEWSTINLIEKRLNQIEHKLNTNVSPVKKIAPTQSVPRRMADHPKDQSAQTAMMDQREQTARGVMDHRQKEPPMPVMVSREQQNTQAMFDHYPQDQADRRKREQNARVARDYYSKQQRDVERERDRACVEPEQKLWLAHATDFKKEPVMMGKPSSPRTQIGDGGDVTRLKFRVNFLEEQIMDLSNQMSQMIANKCLYDEQIANLEEEILMTKKAYYKVLEGEMARLRYDIESKDLNYRLTGAQLLVSKTQSKASDLHKDKEPEESKKALEENKAVEDNEPKSKKSKKKGRKPGKSLNKKTKFT